MVHVLQMLMAQRNVDALKNAFLMKRNPDLSYKKFADILVLLDGSASVNDHDFKYFKNFVRLLVKSFTISHNGVQLGVIEFSDQPRLIIPLNKFYDEDQINNAIGSIQPSRGHSRIDAALEFARRVGFSLMNGARPSAHKTLVLLTDGLFPGGKSLDDAVTSLSRANILLYVVTIGNEEQTSDVSSVKTSGGYVNRLDEAKKINTVVPGLLNKINENLNKVTNEKTDMIFAFGADGSYSIFNMEKKLAKEIIDSFDTIDIKYSVIKYGDNAQTVLPFSDVSSSLMLKQFIDAMPWEKPGLAIDKVINKTLANFKNNGRPSARRVLVLFVSGRSTVDDHQSLDLKRSLAEAGVNTVVIAINILDEMGIKRIIPADKPIINIDINKNTKKALPSIISDIFQDPCRSIVCPSSAKCVYDRTGAPICRCNDESSCIGQHTTICGSNRKTYKSICLMKVMSCIKNEDVKVKHVGACEPTVALDVIFALDGSVNIRSKDFEKMKDFVKDVESFISSLNNIQQSSGRSAVTDEVLRMAASEAFKSFSGGRPTAQRRLIIITGSKSAGSEPVQEAVIPVIREDIQVYVIGVGPRINRKEIMEIVAPNDDRKYILDALQLETLVQPIKMKILNEAQQGYNLKSICHNCTPTRDVNDYLFLLLAMNNTKLDIVFVLGARNPFASRDFDVMKKIAQEMIKQPRPSGTLYGFVTYSDRGITRLTPDIPKEILMKLLDLIPWQNEGTRVDKGLRRVLK
ncbi:collagen alpha-6(VI) chain-like [Xenia sp. Carnegie-2017]|uniref:collagen alpha-6(VI) chain-like n=1 Tax=Xenia sp. Carnegie-2017 TaxID=2897299 RepID=UPI001F0482B6|nr:collagen alpha-6(VI) chain-like [Xenia sp. Carnegie-2017]